MPTPAPVIGATLARSRNTSAKGSVTGEKADPGVDAIAHLENGGDVSAGAEEGGVPEGILAAITADDVPALPGKGDHQRHYQEIEDDVRVHDERHGGEHRDHGGYGQKRLHALAPNKPRGRSSSTAMKIRKMPTW